jgi:tRNA nucleotidyltransferase/poly(A) polymerase
MRFLGHEAKGAERISDILKRLRVATSDIKTASNLVAHHMRPISLTQANILTQRALFRFYRDIGDNTIDLIMLTLSDWHSYKGLKYHEPGVLRRQESVLKEIIRRYFQEKEKPALPRIIDGNIIMKRFKLQEGPLIGKILSKIKEAQFLGKVRTSEDALSLARKTLKK